MHIHLPIPPKQLVKGSSWTEKKTILVEGLLDNSKCPTTKIKCNIGKSNNVQREARKKKRMRAYIIRVECLYPSTILDWSMRKEDELQTSDVYKSLSQRPLYVSEILRDLRRQKEFQMKKALNRHVTQFM